AGALLRHGRQPGEQPRQPVLGIRPRPQHRRSCVLRVDELQRLFQDRQNPMNSGFSPTAVRRRQRGLSLFGLLIAAALIIMLAIVAMRVVPSALEFMAVRGAVEKIVTSGSTNSRELQQAFDRFAAVDDITAIRGTDLIIEKLDTGTVV